MAETYIEYMAKELITKKLNERELLEQLAEEASELSQAALKLIRAAGYSNNTTPVKEKEAIENLVTEFNDVLVSWSVLLKSRHAIRSELIVQTANGEKRKKLERWAERLGWEEC